MSKPLRFVLLGAGFWARYQLAAWGEQAGVTCVGVCDPDRERAKRLAASVGAAVFTDPIEALDTARPDFADIVTPVGTHASLVRLCAERGIGAICQKPLAPTPGEVAAMLDDCRKAGVPLLVHENWRWQAPLRAAREILRSGRIGQPFRARLTFSCSFPVFDNQPFLRTLEKFILTDIGSHVLDTARFLFGEAERVYCETHRINPTIQGEDVATVMMPMRRADAARATTVICEMSYASRTEHERFPQTYLFVEGEIGSLEIGPDYLVKVTDAEGTHTRRVPPPRYAWADPAYDLVQASMVPCLVDLLSGLRGGSAETTGEDNLQTVRLIAAAYESARTESAVQPQEMR